eukprot:3086418-Amphidinium_carterae.1
MEVLRFRPLQYAIQSDRNIVGLRLCAEYGVVPGSVKQSYLKAMAGSYVLEFCIGTLKST